MLDWVNYLHGAHYCARNEERRKRFRRRFHPRMGRGQRRGGGGGRRRNVGRNPMEMGMSPSQTKSAAGGQSTSSAEPPTGFHFEKTFLKIGPVSSV